MCWTHSGAFFKLSFLRLDKLHPFYPWSTPSRSHSFSVDMVDVDVVEDGKYLRVHTDNKPDVVKNTTALYRKGHSL